MSEMLERVALAIFKSSFHPDDAANEELVAEKRREWTQDWERAERAARAAIEAMREPTETMMKAMQDSGVFDEANAMISFCAARGSHPGGLKKAPMPAAYTIMVDAALSETMR